MKITNTDKEKISNIIKKVELKTSGEFVPVILNNSDHYPAAHYRLALILSGALSICTYYFLDLTDPIILLWASLAGLLTGYLIAFIPFIKRIFTTKDEINEETYQRALQAYFELGVTHTKQRTGVMIFLTLLEKKVFILADAGINEVVAKDYWNDQVAILINSLKQGDVVTGMEKVIEQIGEKLKENFPISSDDENELSNELVTD